MHLGSLKGTYYEAKSFNGDSHWKKEHNTEKVRQYKLLQVTFYWAIKSCLQKYRFITECSQPSGYLNSIGKSKLYED